MSTQQQDGPRRGPGRPVGESGARAAILDAALALFSEHGYDGASLRAIAERAGVDPSLIRHYFGDKASLFAGAVADRSAIPQRLGAAFRGDPAQLGARVADAYLRMWDEVGTRRILLALVRSATTSPHGAEMLREMLGARAGAELDLTVDDPRLRGIGLAISHLFGTAFALHVLRLPMLTALGHEELVELVAPTIQGYLTRPRPVSET